MLGDVKAAAVAVSVLTLAWIMLQLYPDLCWALLYTYLNVLQLVWQIWGEMIALLWLMCTHPSEFYHALNDGFTSCIKAAL